MILGDSVRREISDALNVLVENLRWRNVRNVGLIIHIFIFRSFSRRNRDETRWVHDRNQI